MNCHQKRFRGKRGLHYDGEFSLGDMAIPSQVYNQMVLTQSKAIKLMKRSWALSIVVEIVDDPTATKDNNGKIFKPLSDNDFKKLDKGTLAGNILEKAGAKEI